MPPADPFPGSAAAGEEPFPPGGLGISVFSSAFSSEGFLVFHFTIKSITPCEGTCHSVGNVGHGWVPFTAVRLSRACVERLSAFTEWLASLSKGFLCVSVRWLLLFRLSACLPLRDTTLQAAGAFRFQRHGVPSFNGDDDVSCGVLF